MTWWAWVLIAIGVVGGGSVLTMVPDIRRYFRIRAM